MTALRVYDDARARRFEPFALTRPISTLVAGAVPVWERWRWVSGADDVALIAAPHLAEFDEPGSPRVGTSVARGTIVANSRFAPALGARASLGGDDVHTWTNAGRVAAVRLTTEARDAAFADGTQSLDAMADGGAAAEIDGWWMDEPWDFVRHSQALLAADMLAIAGGALARDVSGRLPDECVRTGAHAVTVASSATIEPFVVIDATNGPVYVGEDSHVRAFTRLSGPCYIGRHVTVMGGDVTGCSIGDHCKVRGELSTSTFIGYGNKGHDGFVGHSYFGRWTNLGAGTTTSNLKNTYGTVSLWTRDGVRDTGMQFLGTLAGDHAKTGIGLRLTTGTVLGAGANVYDRMPPKVVAPFAWGGGAPYGAYRLDKFLEVAERVMSRRSVTLSEPMRRLLGAAYEARWTVDPDRGDA